MLCDVQHSLMMGEFLMSEAQQRIIVIIFLYLFQIEQLLVVSMRATSNFLPTGLQSSSERSITSHAH